MPASFVRLMMPKGDLLHGPHEEIAFKPTSDVTGWFSCCARMNRFENFGGNGKNPLPEERRSFSFDEIEMNTDPSSRWLRGLPEQFFLQLRALLANDHGRLFKGTKISLEERLDDFLFGEDPSFQITRLRWAAPSSMLRSSMPRMFANDPTRELTINEMFRSKRDRFPVSSTLRFRFGHIVCKSIAVAG